LLYQGLSAGTIFMMLRRSVLASSGWLDWIFCALAKNSPALRSSELRTLATVAFEPAPTLTASSAAILAIG
jgi:hypothetical protein